MPRSPRENLFVLLLVTLLACSHADVVSGAPEPSSVSDAVEGGAGTPPAAGAPLVRQRIRKATLHLLVESPSRARKQLQQLITTAGGFLENVETNGPGDTASVVAVARVPETKLDEVVSKARALGRVDHESQESTDVTRAVADVDARLRNLTRTEERLLALLAQQGTALADVIAVERELSRVRGEIEQITAQLNTLKHDVAMSVVTVRMYPEDNRVVEGPDDAMRPMRMLWRDSAGLVASSAAAIVTFFAWLARATLVLLPWSPFLALGWVGWRRLRKARRSGQVRPRAEQERRLIGRLRSSFAA